MQESGRKEETVGIQSSKSNYTWVWACHACDGLFYSEDISPQNIIVNGYLKYFCKACAKKNRCELYAWTCHGCDGFILYSDLKPQRIEVNGQFKYFCSGCVSKNRHIEDQNA